MATATLENIDVNKLSTEQKYALAILENLSVENVNQLKQQMKLGKPGVIGPQTLNALVKLCQDKGLKLTEVGVGEFKAKNQLGNSGKHQGVIGPQTANAYFRELSQSTKPKSVMPEKGVSTDLNAAIVAAANSLFDMCTTDGPDGGNNACAWSLNHVLSKAGIPALGANPNYVPSLLEALQNGRGKLVNRSEAKAGDLVIAYGEAHIGIGLDDGCRTVLSNSSSRGRFRWRSDTDFDGYYGGPSSIYRLIR